MADDRTEAEASVAAIIDEANAVADEHYRAELGRQADIHRRYQAALDRAAEAAADAPSAVRDEMLRDFEEPPADLLNRWLRDDAR